MDTIITRRKLFLGTGSALAASALRLPSWAMTTSGSTEADREHRLQWWHEAKFGMFVHWGLYSVLGRHEWVMENEGIPIAEYEPLAQRFKPEPNAARAWAKLAHAAGMRYIVMTTKHHEGFCQFNTHLTNYCAPKQGPGRDLVQEYVEAARAEGLRVGFYYSLMDWHHPDGARCATDEAARQRFVAYIHSQIRGLLTNYGKIDILWYDMAWPLDAAGWESERMNRMVFELQPDIVVNNRNGIPGDFSTPEQETTPSKDGRAWESCMTLNGSWGYQRADDDWKRAKTVVRNLIYCAGQAGNYLLNIGPRADGSIPQESVQVLEEVGRWMQQNGDSVYGSELCRAGASSYADFTRKGNTLYMHVYFWPGATVALGGLKTRVKGVRLFASNRPVTFQQDEFRLRITGLPDEAPDQPATTFAIECEGEPVQDTEFVRKQRVRAGV